MFFEYEESKNNGRLQLLQSWLKIRDIDDPTEDKNHFMLCIEWSYCKNTKKCYINHFTFHVRSAADTNTKRLFIWLEKEFSPGNWSDFTTKEDRKKATYYLLDHLFIMPGDTDAEVFECYTKEEMEFVLKYGEEIKLCLLQKEN